MYVTEAYFVIIICLIRGCRYEIWGNFHNEATRGSVLYKAYSPHLRTMSADCRGTDRVQCFVSTPIWSVQSTKPWHGAKLQLECVRVVYF